MKIKIKNLPPVLLDIARAAGVLPQPDHHG